MVNYVYFYYTWLVQFPLLYLLHRLTDTFAKYLELLRYSMGVELDFSGLATPSPRTHRWSRLYLLCNVGSILAKQAGKVQIEA